MPGFVAMSGKSVSRIKPAIRNDDCIDLRLSVTNETPRCRAAYENSNKSCEEYAGGMYRITVTDLLKIPEIARAEDVTVIPMLVRVPRMPGRQNIIGMPTETNKVLEELDLPKKPMYRDQDSVRHKTTV